MKTYRALLPVLLVASLYGCKKRVVEPEPVNEPEEGEVVTALSRCKAIGEEVVIGEAGGGGEGEEGSLPFAAGVGQGVAFEDGFLVGASFQRAKETVLGVVFMGNDGKSAHVVELGNARGDALAPRVAARGKDRVVAVVEPSKEGRAIRLARVEGKSVQFGATLHEKRGESLALDLALGSERGLLAWDEDGDHGGRILVSSFDPSTASSASPPRAVTSPTTDAESPQLIPRPGGFYLAYIARKGDDAQPKEDRYVTEAVGFRAIELLLLDEKGTPEGPALAVTPPSGHVVAFDLLAKDDGAIAFVWREDDGPSGSGGGKVMHALVTGEGVGEAVVVEEERVGGGVPSMKGRWLTITDTADTTRLAPLSPSFTLLGPLEAEVAIENGAVLAAKDDVLLIGKPRGRAIRLSAVRCGGE